MQESQEEEQLTPTPPFEEEEMEDVKLDLVEAVHDRTQRLCLEFLVACRRAPGPAFQKPKPKAWFKVLPSEFSVCHMLRRRCRAGPRPCQFSHSPGIDVAFTHTTRANMPHAG